MSERRDAVSRGNLAANLAREWVTGKLEPMRVRATTEAEWVREGVAYPQTTGEYQDPTGELPPNLVDVVVTVPALATEDLPDVIDLLKREADADPHFGGRFTRAHLVEVSDESEKVDSDELGPGARQTTLRFSVKAPGDPPVGS